MGRKPDPETDRIRYTVLVFRECGCSKSLTCKIMRKLGIHGSEESFQKLYRQAKSKPQAWRDAHENERFSSLVSLPMIEQLRFCVQLAGFLTAQSLFHHLSSPQRPDLTPIAKTYLPLYESAKRAQSARRRGRRLPSRVN